MLHLKSSETNKQEVMTVLKLWDEKDKSSREFQIQDYDREILAGLSVERLFRFYTLTQFEDKFHCKPQDVGLAVESLPIGPDATSSKAVPGVLLKDDDSDGLRVRGFYTLQGALSTSIFDGQQQLRAQQAEEIAAWYEGDWRKAMPKSLTKFPHELTSIHSLPGKVSAWREAEEKRKEALKEKLEAEQQLLVPVEIAVAPEPAEVAAAEESSDSDSDAVVMHVTPSLLQGPFPKDSKNSKKPAKGQGKGQKKKCQKESQKEPKKKSVALGLGDNLTTPPPKGKSAACRETLGDSVSVSGASTYSQGSSRKGKTPAAKAAEWLATLDIVGILEGTKLGKDIWGAEQTLESMKKVDDKGALMAGSTAEQIMLQAHLDLAKQARDAWGSSSIAMLSLSICL